MRSSLCSASVRAWRGLRYNEKYAAKLKKKLEQKQERQKLKAKAVEAEKLPKMNPFSVSMGKILGALLRRDRQAGVTANVPAFGLGTQIFGEDCLEKHDGTTSGSENEEYESDEGDSDASSLLTAMTRTVISESPWRSAPAYEPVYLSTVSEYLPPQSKQKLSSGAQVLDADDAKGQWMSEKYENSMYVDPVFERFTRRVAAEGKQCVRYARLNCDGRTRANSLITRYELGGVPLPFASDEVSEKLFPRPQRAYEPSVVEACPWCQSKRVFECQLMPNLINVVGGVREGEGMSWGTCVVFSCGSDCSGCEWREEAVWIEWDM